MARPAKKTNYQRSEFSPNTLRKLEDSFLLGLNNSEACFLANISQSMFYEVCKCNPSLSERFSHLKQYPNLKARQTIVKAIEDGNVKVAMWYLEKKLSNEFGNSPQQVSECKINFSEEAKKRLKKYE